MTGHDSYDNDGNYQRKCYCQKCKRKYDEWCKKNKDEGHASCKQKCYTICEVKCDKEIVKNIHWGYKKEFVGKWERVHAEEAPREQKVKHCNKCKKVEHQCACKRDHYNKHSDNSVSY